MDSLTAHPADVTAQTVIARAETLADRYRITPGWEYRLTPEAAALVVAVLAHRAGAPPCDPNTLGASKAACTERHPVADRGDALTYYCTHDEGEPGCYCGAAS